MILRKHNKRGNCHAVRNRHNDYEHCCMRHEEIRGDCDKCPPCPACDGERIAELEQELERAKPAQGDGAASGGGS